MNIKLHAQKLKVCVLNLSVSQLPNITLTIIGLFIFIAVLHDPSHTGVLTEFATSLEIYIF